MPAPITPAPVTPSPTTQAPITAAPVTPGPMTPAPVTPAPVTPVPVNIVRLTPDPITTLCPPRQCINPITRECSFMIPCPAANYCMRPFPAPMNGEPLLPATCAAMPNAVCQFSGCGGCIEYFEDERGNIITADQCDVQAAPAPVDPSPRCEVGGCNGELLSNLLVFVTFRFTIFINMRVLYIL